MEKKRAVLYCRVARDDAFSLKSQAQELRRYADRNGYTIVGVMSESGSGLTLNRPALSEVTKAVYEGKADVILVKNLARIGRERVLVQEYIDFLNEHKVTLLCVTEGLETSRHNPYPF